jgi:hypothetical protein
LEVLGEPLLGRAGNFDGVEGETGGHGS